MAAGREGKAVGGLYLCTSLSWTNKGGRKGADGQASRTTETRNRLTSFRSPSARGRDAGNANAEGQELDGHQRATRARELLEMPKQLAHDPARFLLPATPSTYCTGARSHGEGLQERE